MCVLLYCRHCRRYISARALQVLREPRFLKKIAWQNSSCHDRTAVATANSSCCHAPMATMFSQFRSHNFISLKYRLGSQSWKKRKHKITRAPQEAMLRAVVKPSRTIRNPNATRERIHGTHTRKKKKSTTYKAHNQTKQIDKIACAQDADAKTREKNIAVRR